MSRRKYFITVLVFVLAVILVSAAVRTHSTIKTQVELLEFYEQELKSRDQTIERILIQLGNYQSKYYRAEHQVAKFAEWKARTGLDIALLLHIDIKCAAAEIPTSVFLGMIEVESNFNPSAKNYNEWNSTQDTGLAQNNSQYGQFYMELAGEPGEYTTEKSLEPFFSVNLGIAYLEHLSQKFSTLEEAVAAYNLGPTAYRNYKNSSGKIETAYSKKVFEAAEKYSLKSS